jgi:hypothetical protein
MGPSGGRSTLRMSGSAYSGFSRSWKGVSVNFCIRRFGEPSASIRCLSYLARAVCATTVPRMFKRSNACAIRRHSTSSHVGDSAEAVQTDRGSTLGRGHV